MNFPPSDIKAPTIFEPGKVWSVALKMEGVKWKHEGKDLNGMDCLGVALYFYRQFGLDLRGEETKGYDIEFWRRDKENKYRKGMKKRGFKFFKTMVGANPGDALLFQFKGVATHIGIFVGRGKFLHCVSRQGVRLVSLADGEWGPRFISRGVYPA